MHREPQGKLVVELDTPICISHRNGPTVPSSTYRFCDDGKIHYRHNKLWKDWTSFEPKWELVQRFPLLPVKFSGFDVFDE